MKLVLAQKWIEETFEEGSEPALNDVKEWVERGEILGRLLGDMVYVDADRFAYTDQTTTNELTVDSLLG